MSPDPPAHRLTARRTDGDPEHSTKANSREMMKEMMDPFCLTNVTVRARERFQRSH